MDELLPRVKASLGERAMVIAMIHTRGASKQLLPLLLVDLRLVLVLVSALRQAHLRGKGQVCNQFI